MSRPQEMRYETMTAMAAKGFAEKRIREAQTTKQIRKVLSDLQRRPAEEREYLCQLLRHAAARTSSVVSPEVTYLKT